MEVEGEMTGYLRHVYFHIFHVKIKCIGALLIQKSETEGCSLDSQSRNLIPELPEQLQCRWEGCGVSIVARLTSRIVVVVLLFYVHGKHLRSCRDGQLT